MTDDDDDDVTVPGDADLLRELRWATSDDDDDVTVDAGDDMIAAIRTTGASPEPPPVPPVPPAPSPPEPPPVRPVPPPPPPPEPPPPPVQRTTSPAVQGRWRPPGRLPTAARPDQVEPATRRSRLVPAVVAGGVALGLAATALFFLLGDDDGDDDPTPSAPASASPTTAP